MFTHRADKKYPLFSRLILYTAFAHLIVTGISFKANGQTIPLFRTADWSLAGNHYDFSAHGGNMVNVLNYGAAGDGVTDNYQAINAALLTLGGTGSTLYFPPGVYLINGFFSLPDSITLLGYSADSTILLFNAGEYHDAISVAGNPAGNFIAVVNGYGKNSKQIMVADSNLFVAGDFAALIQDGTLHMTSAWAMESLGQMLVIDSVDGNMLYLNQPLRMDYDPILNPRIRRIHPRRAASIECMQIRRVDSTGSQTANIAFDFAKDCRVVGVESKRCNFAHIDIRRSSGITIRSSYFHEGHSYGEGGKAYGVCVNATSGDCLVENNIFRKLRHSILLQSGANGNVFGYNYSTEPFWTDTLFPADAAGDIVLHGNYPYLNLFEGNIVQNIVIDDSHGKNGPHNTFFRNRADLYGIFMNNNPATDSLNFVGNEIPVSVFPLGLYYLNGINHFQSGNNVKGVVSPTGTGTLPDISYCYKQTPSYWIVPDPFPSIGIPNILSSNTIPGMERFLSGMNLATCFDTIAINGISVNTSHSVGFEIVSCLFRPAQSTLELMINTSKNQSEVFAACYNLLGIRLADGAFKLHEGMNAISLPLKPGQAKGVFVIRVMQQGVSKTVKVVGI